MPRKFVRVLAMSDTHCGHDLGLTHPEADPGPHLDGHKFEIRRSMWDWFVEATNRLNPDILIFNGDAIDGKGRASGGTEQIESDRLRQTEMAAMILESLGDPKIYMSYGTPYHTGKEEDWEDVLARRVGAVKIGGEDNLDVRGVVFNYKHHLSRSGVPYGRFTSIARDRLWNILWASRGEYPLADIILRSHVHYNIICGEPGEWLAMTLPSLQGYGTKYGGRRMTGTVDVGFAIFDVYEKGVWRYEVRKWRAPFQAPLTYEE